MRLLKDIGTGLLVIVAAGVVGTLLAEGAITAFETCWEWWHAR